jgi:hypothetical protein
MMTAARLFVSLARKLSTGKLLKQFHAGDAKAQRQERPKGIKQPGNCFFMPLP